MLYSALRDFILNIVLRPFKESNKSRKKKILKKYRKHFYRKWLLRDSTVCKERLNNIIKIFAPLNVDVPLLFCSLQPNTILPWSKRNIRSSNVHYFPSHPQILSIISKELMENITDECTIFDVAVTIVTILFILYYVKSTSNTQPYLFHLIALLTFLPSNLIPQQFL